MADELGIDRIALDAWYSREAWLTAFSLIVKQVGQAMPYDVEVKTAANAQFPEWVVDVPSASESIDFADRMNHGQGGAVTVDPSKGQER